MTRGFGLVCLIVCAFSDVTNSEKCYSKSNDQALNLQCHKYCSEGTCPTFCVCGNKALDTCDPLNFTNNNTMQVLETVTPGTTIFTINITGKEEWDFTLERGGVVDGSIWNHLSTYLKLTKIGGEYEMIVDRTPDLEDIFYRYAIKLTKLTIHLNCKRGSVSDLSHTITIKIVPVNEYAPEFLGAPLIQNVAEDTKVDTLVYSLSNHAMDMDVNPTANELAAFEIVDYLPDTRHDGRAYFHMKDNVKGSIMLQKALDFEALQPLSATRFFLNLSATDIHGNSSFTTLTINVIDVDDLPPEFYHPGCPLVATKSRPCLVSYEASVPFNYQGPITDIVPGLIEARDMDTQDHPVEYSLEPAPGEKPENMVHFSINKTNGDVTVVSPFSKKTEINLVIVAKEMSEAGRSTQASLYIKVDRIKSGFSPSYQDIQEDKTEAPSIVLGLGRVALIIIGALSGITLVQLFVVLFLCGKVRSLSNSVHPSGVGPVDKPNYASQNQPKHKTDKTSAPNNNNLTLAQTQSLAPLGASDASRPENYNKPNVLFSQQGDRSHNSTSNKTPAQEFDIDEVLNLSAARSFVYTRDTSSVPPTLSETAKKTDPNERRIETRASNVLDSSNKRITRRSDGTPLRITVDRRHSDWVDYEDDKTNRLDNRKVSTVTSPDGCIREGESIDSLSTDTLGSPRSDQRERANHHEDMTVNSGVAGEDLTEDLHYSSRQFDFTAESPENEELSNRPEDYNTSDVLSILPIDVPSFSCLPSENQARANKSVSADINTHFSKTVEGVHSKTNVETEGGSQNILNHFRFPRNAETLQQFRKNPLHLPRSISRTDATNWMSNNPGYPRGTALLLNSAPMRVDVRPFSSPGEYHAVGRFGVQLPNRPWTCVYKHQVAQATAAEIEQWKRQSGTWLNAANTSVRHPPRPPSNTASQTSHVPQDAQQQYTHFDSQPMAFETMQQYIPYISHSSHVEQRPNYVSVPSYLALDAQHPDIPQVSQPPDTVKRSPTSLSTSGVTRDLKKTRPSSHVTRKSWSGIYPKNIPLKKVKKKDKCDLRSENQPEEEDLRSRSKIDANAEHLHRVDQQSQTFQLNQSFDGLLHREKSSQTLQEVGNFARSRRLPAMRIPQHQRNLKQIQRSHLKQRSIHEQDMLNVNRTHDGDFYDGVESNSRHDSNM